MATFRSHDAPLPEVLRGGHMVRGPHHLAYVHSAEAERERRIRPARLVAHQLSARIHRQHQRATGLSSPVRAQLNGVSFPLKFEEPRWVQ